PSTDQLFSAIRGQGLSLNDKPLALQPTQDAASLVMVSTREFRSGRWAGLDGLVQCRPMFSIANALALVAAGQIHATITIEPENEWDLAAGVLLVEESGGAVADAQGRPFTFNQQVPLFHGIIAVAATAGRELRPLLQAHADRARTKRMRS
ncbi:MAG TPA: inositol monophosphatase family protein, partial [Nitrospira sp.]